MEGLNVSNLKGHSDQDQELMRLNTKTEMEIKSKLEPVSEETSIEAVLPALEPTNC